MAKGEKPESCGEEKLDVMFAGSLAFPLSELFVVLVSHHGHRSTVHQRIVQQSLSNAALLGEQWLYFRVFH